MAGAGADGERRIGVAMDYSDSSKKALGWAVDNLLRRGDTLVVVHVLHHGGEETKHALWAKSGSRKHPAAPLLRRDLLRINPRRGSSPGLAG